MATNEVERVKHNGEWLIRERVDGFIADDVCGSLDCIIEFFADIKECHSDYIDLYSDEDWGHEDNYSFNVFGYREETEKEEEKRLKKAQKVREQNKTQRIKNEEKELKEFKKLYKKYGLEGAISDV